jgi:starch synthase
MKILMAASEAVPFAKTGGLGDAVSALSLALARLGHEVCIVLPRYYNIDRRLLTQLEGAMGVPTGGGEEWCAVYRTEMPGSKKSNPVRVYFVDHEGFFGRDAIYGTPWEPDFLDNPKRFTFLCRSVFQLCRKIDWFPDIIHAHDWAAALVPVLLKYEQRQGPFENTSSVLTIHNLGYQGIYSKDNFPFTGLGWNVFVEGGFEDGNMMNFLKAGVWAADQLSTVSERYAEETKERPHGFRLDLPLRYRSADYRGILNGVDTELWNPAMDRYIPMPYTAKNMTGKAKAKEALQKMFGLPNEPDTPIVGMVTRLAGQKGVGELFGPGYGCAWGICRDMRLHFVLQGMGESWCENEVRNLTAHQSNFKGQIGYNEEVAHLVEAGSDFFLMPSQYEPCGLNQMYSLLYGTPPIVRNTGGLADTVENYNQKRGTGTGFMFDDLTPRAIYHTVKWAIDTYHNKREDIEEMRLRGMNNDFSWKKSSEKYIEMYHDAQKKLLGSH